ncbi:class F sortase [Actinomycetospora sp. CA-101289]|uniref:class F sortase n=1 Tax=Actinomycetospora sp. CA-101289 TaxID=3239893 RepID=UPI003D95EA64
MGRRTRLGRWAGTTALALVTTAMGVTGIAAAASLPSAAPAPDRLPAPTAPQENGLLRVAHLSPSTGAVDMYAEGPGLPATRVASAVSYRGLTSYLPAAPGTYTLSARPAGASATSVPALTTTVAVTPGSAQTAAFVDVGPNSTPQAEVIADRTTAPPPGSALVRVITAAAGVGAVDVVAQGGGPLADDVFYGATSDYATVDARVWTMDITTSSGQSTQVTVPVASRSVSSVIVSRDPQGALAVTAVPDAASATPAAEAPAAPAAPAASAPATSAPTAPSSPRRTPTGGVPAGFGGLVAADAPAIPAARPMPVVAVPTGPRDAVRPTGLVVPAADVDAGRLLDLGVDGAGALQAPPGPQDVGWFAGGAVPGEAGPSVLVGHVDSWRGPGVFWRLRDLRAGDAVDVPRSDGTVAHFVVDAVERFDKDAFPSERVYGPTAGPSLRLVTCGGAFDRSTRSYVDNVVVFASPR